MGLPPARRTGIARTGPNTVADVAARPRPAARGRRQEGAHSWGRRGRCFCRCTLPGGARTPMGAAPAPGEHTDATLRALGMTGERIAALRRDEVVSDTARSGGPDRVSAVGQRRLPKSERLSRRSGAKSETRALLLLRLCEASREVSSSISSVASAESPCGTAGPPSTARWRSSRELVALLPHVMAGTRGLLRTVICSMSLPTRTRAPGPGRLTLSSRGDTRVSRLRDCTRVHGC